MSDKFIATDDPLEILASQTKAHDRAMDLVRTLEAKKISSIINRPGHQQITYYSDGLRITIEAKKF